MMPRFYRTVFTFCILLLSNIALFHQNQANAETSEVATKVAIDGYDTVAYFTLKKATRGSKQFTHQWNDKIWYFSSAENRELFAASPERFAPQFNGFCANGLSDGHAVAANPKNWRIIDGKLYLFFSEYGRDQWQGNVKPLIEEARQTFQNQ